MNGVWIAQTRRKYFPVGSVPPSLAAQGLLHPYPAHAIGFVQSARYFTHDYLLPSVLIRFHALKSMHTEGFQIRECEDERLARGFGSSGRDAALEPT